VTQNILYGISFPTLDMSDVEDRDGYVANMLARFRISHLADKMPRELSGGETQRVNLTRAVAAGPGGKRWLLLDEPFTGLDVSLRDELIAELQNWQATSGTPVLSVTHDVAEAFQLGAEVIKLAEGRVVAQGPVEVVLAEERRLLLEQLKGAAGSPA
jgi:molybdate transport system ATP-binding protein